MWRASVVPRQAQLMRQLLPYQKGYGCESPVVAGWCWTPINGHRRAYIRLLTLDDALNGLARLDPQQCQIVELRFFGGLTLEETSQELNISPATVKRDWATARIWLHHYMSRK